MLRKARVCGSVCVCVRTHTFPEVYYGPIWIHRVSGLIAFSFHIHRQKAFKKQSDTGRREARS